MTMAALQAPPSSGFCASYQERNVGLSSRSSILKAAESTRLGQSALRLKATGKVNPAQRSSSRARATQAAAELAVGETFELELEKPYGIKFFRGEDGAIYIDALTPGCSGQLSGKLQEGDKLVASSAIFGDEMWPAAEYGRTMYAIKGRIGPMVMRFQKGNGTKPKWFQQAEYLKERAAGNYGDAIREKQIENYAKKLEAQEKRDAEMETGLALYKQGKFDEAVMRFQGIMSLQPEYGEAGVAFYNIACCHSKLGQVSAGLDALDAAMGSGFDDYKKIRQDPDLANLRNSDNFDDVMDKYDEPIINENAIKALTSMLGFFGKK